MIDHFENHFSGAGEISLYYQSWRAEQAPGGVFTIVHGFGGHSGLFLNLVEALTNTNYAVYGYDLCGHGRSPGRRDHDKELHIYPGMYHVTHNDFCHEQVIADLEAWMKKHL